MLFVTLSFIRTFVGKFFILFLLIVNLVRNCEFYQRILFQIHFGIRAAQIQIRNDLFQIQLRIRIRQGSKTLPATQINAVVRIHNPAPGSTPQPPVDL